MNLFSGYKFLKACFIRITKAILTSALAIKFYLLLLNCVCACVCVQNNLFLVHPLKQKTTVCDIRVTANQPCCRANNPSSSQRDCVFFSSIIPPPQIMATIISENTLPVLRDTIPCIALIKTVSSGHIIDENRSQAKGFVCSVLFS